MATAIPATTIRLTDEDHHMLEVIGEEDGLRSRSAVIRRLIALRYREIQAAAAGRAAPRKSRKGA